MAFDCLPILPSCCAQRYSRFGGKTYIRGVMYTTLDRQITSTNSSFWAVLRESWSWVGLVFALALIGTVVSFVLPGRARWVCVTLTAAVLLAPLHQAQLHTTVSLHKHVAFGAWFGAIAAGYALAKVREVNAAKAWRAGAITVAITAFIRDPQATQLFVDGWPNTSLMTAYLAKMIPADGCPCLIAQQSPVSYYLPELASYDIVGPYSFYYRTSSGHTMTHGIRAYEAAIRRHFFSVIEIDPAENPEIYGPVIKALRATAGYAREHVIRIAAQPQRTIQIWLYTGNGA